MTGWNEPSRLVSWGRLAAVLLALLLYAGALGHDFLIDDETIIAANIRLAPGQSPLQIFRRPEQFADFTLPYYRPLTNLTYWLDSRIWGLRPGGFHLSNWLLHGANTLLSFQVALALSGRALPAVLCAVLFASHPIHSESVSMVQGRTDLLVTLFTLLGLLAFRRALRASTSGQCVLASAGSLAAFAAALLSKETATTWPLLAVGLVWLGPATTRAWRSRYMALGGGAFLVLAAYLLLRWHLLGQIAPFDPGSFGAARGGLVAITLATYLRFLVWPFSFSFVRTIPVPDSLWEPRVLSALLLAALILAGAVVLLRRHRLGAVAMSWTLIPLLPVLNVFPIPGFTVAERYMYLPSVGFCLLSALVLEAAIREDRRLALRAAGLVSLLALVGLFAATIQARSAEWADPVRVYERMVAHAPASFFVQGKLGLEYLAAGRIEEAVLALTRARDLEPKNPVAWNNLGVALARRGRLPEARDAYRQAIALRPGYVKAYENLGLVLAGMGDGAGAEAAFARAQALAAEEGAALRQNEKLKN
ncbi:MAG: tetratricopeptide repeat protein [candidate division NC10 bacterium]|nr:tetratricopeptide repeat protein [candidate division NC10 bacterium]